MTTTTYQTRFNEKHNELREIAASLGRVEIFDRDLRGQGGDGVPANSREAMADAMSGVGWYLDEEHEWDGEQGYVNDPRTAKYASIVRYIEEGAK
jgi:predicted dehydrogenase